MYLLFLCVLNKSTNRIEYQISTDPSSKLICGIRNKKSCCLLKDNTSQGSNISFHNMILFIETEYTAYIRKIQIS